MPYLDARAAAADALTLVAVPYTEARRGGWLLAAVTRTLHEAGEHAEGAKA